jgi:hypothetical protein
VLKDRDFIAHAPRGLQLPLILQFLFDRLAFGDIEAAATISRAERRTAQAALTKKLTKRQAAELAAVMAFNRPLIILTALHGLAFCHRAIAAGE